MANRIQIRRGQSTQIPVSNLKEGEPLFALDTGELRIATSPSSSLPAVTNITLLESGSIVAGDLFEFYDVSETSGIRNKQISFTDLKSSFNIPSGSSDEKVAVASGETAGYLVNVVSGSQGINIIQSGSVLSFTANLNNVITGSNGINVTFTGSLANIELKDVDGGTFV